MKSMSIPSIGIARKTFFSFSGPRGISLGLGLLCRIGARNISIVSAKSAKEKGKTGLRILKSTTTNPFFNLATEDWLFRTSNPATQTLFIWRNGPSVVIGKHQDPFAECKLVEMKDNGVELVRRHSGGGAVYQDLGNTNFTFLSGVNDFDKQRNFRILINALNDCGVSGVQTSGRNDMVVNGMKISGSAFRVSDRLAFHHGTLLLHVDLQSMSKFLTPSRKKLKSKGVKSVRARVTNLINICENKKMIEHEYVCGAIANSFCEEYGVSTSMTPLDMSILRRKKSLLKEFNQLNDYKWRFGEAPTYEYHAQHYFDWGLVDVYLDVNNGGIRGGRIYSDSLQTHVIDCLNYVLNTPLVELDCDLYGAFSTIPYTKQGIEFIKNTTIKELSKSISGSMDLRLCRRIVCDIVQLIIDNL